MIQMENKTDVKDVGMDYDEFKKFNDISITGVNVWEEPQYKAKLQIGNLQFMSVKKFNWFKRFMLKVIFGIEVENLK